MLEVYAGGGLEPDGDYDGLEFHEEDFAGQDGGGARFMDCALTGCALDETRLHRARVLDSVLTGIRGVGTDLAEATLRDVELVDARLGGVQLHGAVLERVLVRGGRSTTSTCVRPGSRMWSSRTACWSSRISRVRGWSGSRLWGAR